MNIIFMLFFEYNWPTYLSHLVIKYLKILDRLDEEGNMIRVVSLFVIRSGHPFYMENN